MNRGELMPRSRTPQAAKLAKQFVASTSKPEKMAKLFFDDILAAIEDELKFKGMDTIIDNVNEGPLDGISNFASGLKGAAQARSKNPKTKAKGKRNRARAAAKRAASPGGQKRKVAKLVDAMLTQWAKYENQMTVKGDKVSSKMFNQWYANFMGPDRADKITVFNASPTDQEITKFLKGEVAQFAKPAAPKIPKGNQQIYKVDNQSYTWQGGNWINDKTNAIAKKIVGQALSDQAPRESKMYNTLMGKYLKESGQS